MYFLGIDGGGTKTTAVLADANGEVIRTLQAGPGNVAVLRKERTKELIAEVISKLLRDESVDRLSWVTLGFAGAKESTEKAILNRILTELNIRRFSVLTDAELLYFAALGEAPGIVLAAGTGSVCVGKDESGQVIEFGGWGYLLGDDGSGYHLGRLAMRTALQESDRGVSLSKLSREVLAFFDVRHPRALVSKVHSSDNPQFLMASCARLVSEHASNREPNATRCVDMVAQDLCSLTEVALKRLDMAPPIATGIAGSLLREGSILLSRFKALIEQKGLKLQYYSPEMQPAAAAVLHALEQAGIPANESVVEKLKGVDFE